MFDRSQFMLIPLSETAAGLVLRWRNSDRVRESMLNSAVITPAQHKEWIKRILQDESARYRVFCFNDLPVGLVYFTQIDRDRKHCTWGFYLGENNLPKGMGTALGYCALNDMFASFDFLGEITGEVLGSNFRSVALHNRLGFVRKGVRTMQRHGRTAEIVSFLLSRLAWFNAQRSLAERLFEEKI